jgi:gas vesicle protein
MGKSTKSKIALGLILGVAAGAAVYYFMTNENGKEQFSDLLDAVKDFSDKAKETALDQSSRLVSQASEASSKIMSRASEISALLADTARKQAERVN